jgi:hypothetical protein
MTRRLTLLAIVATLALTGCDTSPTGIAGGPKVFEGSIPAEGSNLHSLMVTKAGGVRVEVDSLVADPPLDAGFFPSVGFGLGDPDGADGCRLTFTTSINENSRLSFGLSEREYCIRIFDNGSIGEDAVRIYSILAQPSE